MINMMRSLHHLTENSLEELERELLKLNLATKRSVEVFQVEKIGKKWTAFFNMDTSVFNRYIKEAKRGLNER